MKRFPWMSLWLALVVPFIGAGSRSASAQTVAGKIVFESWEATATQAASRSRVGLMNADGSNAINLTDTTINNFDDWNPSFNRDGSKIVFLSDRTGVNEVYIMNADGTGQTRISKISALKPAIDISEPLFSPDGTKILFTGAPPNVPNFTWEVYLMNVDGSGLTKLTSSVPGTGGAFSAAFTPDGRKILFERGGINFNTDLCTMNLDGSGTTVLTSIVAGSSSGPAISPDGSKIVMSINGALVLMNADGTGQTVIYNAGFSGSPVFSPDGAKIAFSTALGDTSEIFTMNLDGSNLTQVTFGPGISPPSSIEANGPGSWAPGSVGYPTLISLTLNPTSVFPGNGLQGTVSLNQAAPAGGVVIALASSSTSAALPPSVIVPAGATSAAFPISTVSVPALTIATLTAAFDGVSQSATLKIDPAQQTSVIAITQNQYTISQKQLQVQATSSSPTDTLTLYVTSTGALIGTMTNSGGGKYQIKTTWPVNPQNITIKSSLGGSATGAVTAHS